METNISVAAPEFDSLHRAITSTGVWRAGFVDLRPRHLPEGCWGKSERFYDMEFALEVLAEDLAEVAQFSYVRDGFGSRPDTSIMFGLELTPQGWTIGRIVMSPLTEDGAPCEIGRAALLGAKLAYKLATETKDAALCAAAKAALDGCVARGAMSKQDRSTYTEV